VSRDRRTTTVGNKAPVWPSPTYLHVATEEGIRVREIAETIGHHLGVPAVSITAGQGAGPLQGLCVWR
jgi:hypothetical protein